MFAFSVTAPPLQKVVAPAVVIVAAGAVDAPTHWQLALSASFAVQAFPSLHGVPGMAGPPTTPLQSAVAPGETAVTPSEVL